MIQSTYPLDHLKDSSKYHKDSCRSRATEWIEENVVLDMDKERARQFILDGKCKFVTDGSFFGHITKLQGSSFWIIENQHQQRIATGKCGTTTGPSNPYRAELTGLYGLLSTVQYLLEYQCQRMELTIGCDCKGALSNLNWVDRRIKLSKKNHDITRAINTVLCQSKFIIKIK